MNVTTMVDDRVITAIENAPQHTEWDRFVSRAQGAEVAQTSSWARLKARTGLEFIRIVVRRRRDIVGGLQLFERRARGLGAVGYVPYGPLFAADAPPAAFGAVAAVVHEAARRRKLRAVFVQPPEGGQRAGTALEVAGFEPSQTVVAPDASLRLDTSLTDDELLRRMTRHARDDMRRSRRQPLDVRRARRVDLASFAELHEDTARRQRFAPTPRSYFEAMWDELEASGHLAVFLVAAGGVDLAGLLVSRAGDRVTSRFVGFAPARLPARLRPNEALTWAAIEWTRACGARWYDVGGIGRGSAEALAAGADPNRPDLRDGKWGHKVGTGGEAVLYPRPLELLPNGAVRLAYRALRSNTHLRTAQNALLSRIRGRSLRTERSA